MVRYEPVIWDIESTGTNPLAQHWWSGSIAAQVTAVGMATVDGWRRSSNPEDVDLEVTVLFDSDEYRLLNVMKDRFWEAFNNAYLGEEDDDGDSEPVRPVLVGYSSRNFDHPYVGARYSRKRIDGSPFTYGTKRLDMMRVAGDKEDLRRYPSQTEYAELMGYYVEDEYDGSQMPDFFENKEWDKIKSHVRADAKELARCFVADREAAMRHFYGHYDIDKVPMFQTGVAEW